MYKIPAKVVLAGRNVIYVPECHSTNSLLIELNEKAPVAEGTVLITDNQTAGRGQRGNQWHSEPGLNLTFSILFRPVFLAPRDQFLLNMAVSLSVAEAIQPLVSLPVALKWPNDIVIGGKKTGGILIENQLAGQRLELSVVGIGINVNQLTFGIPQAASLFHFTGGELPLNDALARVLEKLDYHYLNLSGGLTRPKAEYLRRLYLLDTPARFKAGNEEFQGTVRDVDDDGRLCLETPAGVRAFRHKEVEYIW